MKYTFLAPLHYLEISTTLNKGINIKNNMRLTNSSAIIELLMDITDIYEFIGAVSYHELKGSTYMYAEGNLEDLHGKYGERDLLEFCFMFLRECSSFLEILWGVKDHSAYVRDGFFYLHNPINPKNGRLQRASLSKIASTCEGSHQTTVFEKEEILQIKGDFAEYEFNFDTYLKHGAKYPLSNPFNKALSRIERSQAFVSIARDQSILPLKIFNYCTALECLFTSDNTEVTHKIAERVSKLLGSTFEERKIYFEDIKKAYGIRSKLTHGQPINLSDQELIESSKALDTMLREIFKNNFEVFSLENKKDYNDYFLKLLLH